MIALCQLLQALFKLLLPRMATGMPKARILSIHEEVHGTVTLLPTVVHTNYGQTCNL